MTGSTVDSSGLPTPYMSRGLYPSLWPSDHQNTSRTKFVKGGGLPAGFSPESVKSLSSAELPYVQWMYTREPDELYVYGVPPNTVKKPYFAKVDAQTLQIKQRLELPMILYIGGALMHANGDVFLVHGPTLHRFKGGDLTQHSSLALPRSNGVFSQYNGMLVSDDGHLLLKGWALSRHDTAMIWRLFLLPVIPTALLNLLGWPLLYGLVGIPALWVALITFGLPLLLSAAFLVRKQTSMVEFMRPRGTGNVLSVHPERFEIVHKVTSPERLAFARMSMAPVQPGAPGVGGRPEWLVIPGDETVVRYRVEAGQLTLDDTWPERYRTWGDGSFVGTGPSIWGRQVYYTDNTFPVDLSAGYRLFRKPLDSTAPQQAVEISDNEPDFMFFSTVVAPSAGNLIVWGTARGKIQARDLKDLSLRWQVDQYNSDCVCVADDRHHLYTADHSRQLTALEWMQTASRRPQHPDTLKSFVVLDVRTGESLLRVPLSRGAPVASMIVPGYHGSVYVSTREALFRVYAEPS